MHKGSIIRFVTVILFRHNWIEQYSVLDYIRYIVHHLIKCTVIMPSCICKTIFKSSPAYLYWPVRIKIFTLSTINNLWFYIFTYHFKISISIGNTDYRDGIAFILSPVILRANIWWFFLNVIKKAFLPVMSKWLFIIIKVQYALSRLYLPKRFYIMLCYRCIYAILLQFATFSVFNDRFFIICKCCQFIKLKVSQITEHIRSIIVKLFGHKSVIIHLYNSETFKVSEYFYRKFRIGICSVSQVNVIHVGEVGFLTELFNTEVIDKVDCPVHRVFTDIFHVMLFGKV